MLFARMFGANVVLSPEPPLRASRIEPLQRDERRVAVRDDRVDLHVLLHVGNENAVCLCRCRVERNRVDVPADPRGRRVRDVEHAERRTVGLVDVDLEEVPRLADPAARVHRRRVDAVVPCRDRDVLPDHVRTRLHRGNTRVVQRIDDRRRRVEDDVARGRPDLPDAEIVRLLSDRDQAVRLDIDVMNIARVGGESGTDDLRDGKNVDPRRRR